ncbi:ferredoxin [Mycobacterium deserti]|uniref:Ferredoxin n=1 Tax=Mycobacterium deserti TaxID=2978347 RepID=A0ABT2M6X7_9MYCO|nr:ferredoxin [Mycobacterium deserti]MCT7658012.1 ferredoxin [Mycobacterium deserti]
MTTTTSSQRWFESGVDLFAPGGHGLCAQVATDIYEVDAEGFARVLAKPVEHQMVGDARAGAEACPVAALQVRPIQDSAAALLLDGIRAAFVT